MRRYEVSHTLIRSGRHSIHVHFGGQPLRGSPVNFRVCPGQAAGRKSRLVPYAHKPASDAEGSGGAAAMQAAPATRGGLVKLPPAEVEPPKPLVGVPYWVSLQARDAHGNAIEDGGTSVELQVADLPPRCLLLPSSCSPSSDSSGSLLLPSAAFLLLPLFRFLLLPPAAFCCLRSRWTRHPSSLAPSSITSWRPSSSTR